MIGLLLVIDAVSAAVAGLLLGRREGRGYAAAGVFAGLALGWLGVLLVWLDRRSLRRARLRAG